MGESLSMNRPEYKIGTGHDVHRLVAGRRLVLGGKEIPFEKGLEGHSDADVLVHAVCDAILGALGCGDIGEHFPDTDPAYKGISSLVLLENCRALMEERGYAINNLDCIVFAEKPKLSPHKKDMEENLARVLKTAPGLVNIKATTTEGLGFTGRQEGIAAQCTLLLKALSH